MSLHSLLMSPSQEGMIAEADQCVAAVIEEYLKHERSGSGVEGDGSSAALSSISEAEATMGRSASSRSRSGRPVDGSKSTNDIVSRLTSLFPAF